MDEAIWGGKMIKYWIAALLAGTSAIGAQAEWHEASSEHFLVIADQNEKDVRDFSQRLELYHSALSFVLGRKSEVPSPSNRVTVYIVRDVDQVKKIAGVGSSSSLAGFYQPRAGGSIAFAPRVETEGKDVSSSEQILFHEYAHHMMHSKSAWRSPRWYSEGFAEFFSTVRFEKNGNVGIGLPANHRAYELSEATRVPLTLLLDSDAYAKKRSKTYDAFYGRSWLLYHYLTLSGKRKGQLDKYLVALAKGKTEMDAANEAFGDLKALDREMTAYLNKSTLSYSILPANKLSVGPISVRKMREGEAAIMPVILISKRGVNSQQADALLPKAQAVAAKFPNDPTVLSALAEAEYDAGNNSAAIAASEKVLAIDPKNLNGMVQKIYALSKEAQDAEAGKADWTKVRKAIVALNKVEPDNPIALIHYYNSLKDSGQAITDLAAHGLERALELAPFDKGLRFEVAQQQISEKLYASAIKTLLPLANDPHQNGEENPAQKLLDEVKILHDKKLKEQEAGAEKK
jgi:tetratricopeptide (TPR) repeat protein